MESGLDANSNGTLENSEVGSTSFTCNGNPGAPGAPVSPGAPDAAGIPGTPCNPGEAGFSSLVLTTSEPAGANCTNGGVRVQSGLDNDRSGSLEAAEMTSTAYICIGATVATAKSWRTAQLIETDDTGNAVDPQIAIDNNGKGNGMAVWRYGGMAVWNQFDGARISIYANRFSSATGAWGKPVLLENDNVFNANSE